MRAWSNERKWPPPGHIPAAGHAPRFSLAVLGSGSAARGGGGNPTKENGNH